MNSLELERRKIEEVYSPSDCTAMLRIVAIAAVMTVVSAHASMTKPFPRNARDGNLTAFQDGKWPVQGRSAQVGNSGCSCADHEGCAAGKGRPETNGQRELSSRLMRSLA